MDYKEIIKSLRARQLKPVYFLHGEEPFFIDAITEVVENELLTDAEKSFNQSVLYGRDVDNLAVVDIARRYPMMAERQVVIVKEAQDMKSLALLQTYIETPLSTTVLLLAYKHKRLDMRTAFAKSLVKNAVVFESKPLYENQVPDFIRGYLREEKQQIDADALDLLVEYLGTDLGKIVNELGKLRLNTEGSITAATVEKFVGINREYNVFELQKALGARNILQANKIVRYFMDNPKDAPMVMVVGNLYGFFAKIYQLSFLQNAAEDVKIKTLGLRSSWFLKDYAAALKNFPRPKLETIVGLLREFDLKSKGVNADGVNEGELLRELVYKILH